MLDAVSVEHRLAGIMGKPIGGRGGVNDADRVRSQKAKDLIAALGGIIPLLKTRAANLSDSDSMKVWVDQTIRDVDGIKEMVGNKPEKIDGLPCLLLWHATSTSLNWVPMHLKKQNL